MLTIHVQYYVVSSEIDEEDSCFLRSLEVEVEVGLMLAVVVMSHPVDNTQQQHMLNH